MPTSCQPSTCDDGRQRLPALEQCRCAVAVAAAPDAPLPTAYRCEPTLFRSLAETAADRFKFHRTGDVARVAAASAPGGVAAIRKRFWYPTARDGWSGFLRTTFAARSRVAGEAAALARMAALGLQPPLVTAWGEARRHGFLVDSFLYLRELAAPSLDRWLADARDRELRDATLAALGRFVAALHRAGLVDGDLHLRNVLRAADGALVKIDSPFQRELARPWRARAQERETAALEQEIAAACGDDGVSRFRQARAASSCRARTSPAPR